MTNLVGAGDNKYNLGTEDLDVDPIAIMVAVHRRCVLLESRVGKLTDHLSNFEQEIVFLKEKVDGLERKVICEKEEEDNGEETGPIGLEEQAKQEG
jgi:hypothetical protein